MKHCNNLLFYERERQLVVSRTRQERNTKRRTLRPSLQLFATTTSLRAHWLPLNLSIMSRVALRCVALRCVALCCVVLCCVVLCCVALCCVAQRNGEVGRYLVVRTYVRSTLPM